MTTKTILFWAAPSRPDASVPFRRAANSPEVVGYGARLEVDLDRLSPVARFIAEYTTSTFRSGSILRAVSRATNAELLIQQGGSPERVAKLREMYGPSIDGPVSQDWDYGRLEDGVSPEQFFERLARRLIQVARKLVMDRQGHAMIFDPVELDIDRALAGEVDNVRG